MSKTRDYLVNKNGTIIRGDTALKWLDEINEAALNRIAKPSKSARDRRKRKKRLDNRAKRREEKKSAE